MLFAELAAASKAVAATAARSTKVSLIAAALRRAADGGAGTVAVAVAYLAGDVRQRRTGIGYAALRDVPAPADRATLTVTEVDATLERIAALSGGGSQGERRRLLALLMARATEQEQHFLIGLISGELRQGALEGVMLDAVAQAASVSASEVRRAVTVRGELSAVAQAALIVGGAGLERFRLQVGRPLKPMLAQSAPAVAQVLDRLGPAAVEWKLDGVRVQVHRDGDEVGVFTRTLDDVTARLPEVVKVARSLPVRTVVLDGEVIALDDGGRPRPFQVTASRVGRRTDPVAARVAMPLTTFLFDALHLDGADLVGLGNAERRDALESIVDSQLLVPRTVTGNATVAEAFLGEALRHGHEGVVLKALDAPYEAGHRGSGWVKVKPRHTLDLVVLAAEWGHGRRRGWLSNLHLGARGEEGFVMLGKTFKGLTDEMLRWQTEALLALEVSRTAWQVVVRPELVVEVAFDGVQSSPRYPGGMALRFARVLRHRPDKSAGEADTVDAVRAVHGGLSRWSGPSRTQPLR